MRRRRRCACARSSRPCSPTPSPSRPAQQAQIEVPTAPPSAGTRVPSFVRAPTTASASTAPRCCALFGGQAAPADHTSTRSSERPRPGAAGVEPPARRAAQRQSRGGRRTESTVSRRATSPSACRRSSHGGAPEPSTMPPFGACEAARCVEVGLARIDAGKDRGPDLVLGRHRRGRRVDHAGGDRARDDDDAVAVGEDVVAGTHDDLAVTDRLVVGDRNPGADDVASGSPCRRRPGNRGAG